MALRIVHRTGIDRCAAIAAEGVKAFVAAFGRFNIRLGCAAQQHEMLGRCRDVDAKRRSGKRLAISAVADVERIGIDLRLKGDLAAMAVSVDLHSSCPLSGLFGSGSRGGSHPRRVGCADHNGRFVRCQRLPPMLAGQGRFKTFLEQVINPGVALEYRKRGFRKTA